jgi:Protein of unknown function (DUF5818)
MRYLLMLSVLLLGASWATAQYDSNQTSQQKSSSAGSEMTVQGCLSASAGSYTLTDKNGTSYQLTGDSAKLSEHVGHEIKVTGSAASPSPSTGSAKGSMGQTSSSTQQAIEVSSFKHISKTCKSGSMSH